MVTIKDIAKEAKVSTTTVSRVLNNKPDVSENTRKKIKKVIEKLNYNPNSIARSLVLKKSNTIGLIIPDISNPFFPEVSKAIEKEFKKFGYHIIFCNTGNTVEGEKEALKTIKSRQVDGIVLSLSRSNESELLQLKELNFPVVQIDRIVSDKIPSITIDNIESAYKATNYLIELGHQKIAHITGDLATHTAKDRLNGFKKALQEHGLLKENQKFILEADYTKSSGKRMMDKLLRYSQKPTAVFIANDIMAIGAYSSIKDHQLQVPEDISIIGHDDIEIASIMTPTLTTMKQPQYEIGKLAVEKLINLIKDKDINNKGVKLKTKLLKRDSTKKVNN